LGDQPPELGGGDQGMTPPELLLAALAACAGHYAREYLCARSFPIEGLAVRVTAEKAAQLVRIGAFHMDVDLSSAHEESHREGLGLAVKRCLIHNTLLHPPEIEISVAGAAPVVS
jgi:uncharacterized OsmC-like protein